MEFAELLKAIQGRDGIAALSGIGTAKAYAAALGKCLADPSCSERFCGMGAAQRWAEDEKTAGDTLVYRNDDCVVVGGVAAWEVRDRVVVPTPGQVRQFGRQWGAEEEEAAFKRANEPTPGSIMEFDCVLTSTRKDRDGDVLEAAGAEVDPLMPLLWQHIPMMPIGKLVRVLAQNSRRVSTRFAIANTPLGNDAVVLVEFGGLRISHGFRATKFKPLEDKNRRQDDTSPRGWHIEAFKVMEGSLVSIPSNEDATITAWSRAKLCHPMTKAWARELWDAHPKCVKGGWNPEEGPAPDLKRPDPAPTPDNHGCRCGGGNKPKSDTDVPENVADFVPDGGKPYPGEHACRINDPAKYESFRRQNKKADGKTYGLIFGKLKGQDKWELQAVRYKKADWSADEAKAACKKAGGTFEAARGEAATVTVKKRVRKRTRKLVAKGQMKAKDLGRLKAAMQHCDAAMGQDGMPEAAKTLVGRAGAAIKEVHDGHAEEPANKPADQKGKVKKADLKKLAYAADHLDAAKNVSDVPGPAGTMMEAASGLVKEVHGKHSKASDTPADAAEKLLAHLLAGSGTELPATTVRSLKEALEREEEAAAERLAGSLFADN